MFTSTDFTYASTPNTDYNVILVTIDTGAINAPFGIGRQIDTEKIRGNPKPNFYGIEEQPLSFPITLSKTTDAEWTIAERMALTKWLFPKYFQDFISNDDTSIIYKCMPQERPEKMLYGNLPRIFTLNMLCDSPWSYKILTDYTVGVASTPIDNISNINDFYYPEIQFTATGSTFSLKNNTTNKTTTITGLTAGETIYLNYQKQQVISSLDNYLLGNFNKVWLYMDYGINNLQILSGATTCTVRCQFPLAL